MDTVKAILSAAIVLTAVGLFAWVIIGIIQSLLHGSPTVNVTAKVTSKTVETGTSETGNDGLRLGKKVWFASFETPKETIKLQLSESEFNELHENDVGTLYYRGTRFCEFTRDTLISDSNVRGDSFDSINNSGSQNNPSET